MPKLFVLVEGEAPNDDPDPKPVPCDVFALPNVLVLPKDDPKPVPCVEVAVNVAEAEFPKTVG